MPGLPSSFSTAIIVYGDMVRVISILVLGAALCCSCTIGEMVRQVPVTVLFSVGGKDAWGGADGQILLRSSSATAAESLVQDINLYILNEAGDVVTYGYYTRGDAVQADIYDGMDYSIYAIANAGAPLPAKDEAGVKSLTFSLSSPDWLAGGQGTILMAGSLPMRKLQGGSAVVVPLERCAAKVLLKCDYSALNTDVELEVTGLRLRNVPKESSIFSPNRIVSAEGAMDGEPVVSPSAELLEEGVAMYLLENMQGELQSGNTLQSGKVWPEGSLNSQICSYLELEASYASPRKAGDVLYRFYLGKDMLSNYDVQRNVQYDITVKFKGDGAIGENSWRVDAAGLEDVVPPELEFGEESRVMYDLEEAVLAFSHLRPEGADVVAVSSDPSVVQVLGCGSGGVEIKALAPGDAVITASVGGVGAECSIRVEKLRLEVQQGPVTLFNHFYTDIQYAHYPPHAAALGVELASSSTSLQVGFGGIVGRVIPQFPASAQFPVEGTVTLSIPGREDVKVEVPAVVNTMLSISSSITANANMGSTAAVKGLGLSTSPRADVSFSWVDSDGISINGDPGENAVVSAQENTITFPIPNGANGKYRLRAQVIGDDGYGTVEATHTDAVKYCDVTIYETIYLVGISKTMNRERIDSDPDEWKYENEVVAKWLSHPKSLMFPSGELDLDIGFVYKGEEYDDNHTEFMEEFTFVFEKGDYIQYALDAGFSIYNGTPPPYYLEYFFLEAAVSPYVQGSIAEGKPYLYIYSRNFASGFSKEASPDWRKIFEYVYP